MADKLIRRHPHVFGNESADTSSKVLLKWEEIKKGEKKGKSILDGVPKMLPALLKAHRVQEKASRLGFDWDNIKDVEEKLFEELAELKEAVSQKNKNEIYDEAGDILFSIVNLLRFAGINAEEALQSSTNKFINRFSYIEKKVSDLGKNMKEFSLQELDNFWNEAKSKESKLKESEDK
jgi:MazG family protein